MNDTFRIDDAAHGTPTPVQGAWARVVGRIAGVSENETKVSTRGFTVTRSEVVELLESIGHHFIFGYNLALQSSDLSALAGALAQRTDVFVGFAYEGAAMGVAVADWLTPGRRWFDAYVEGPADAHEYMAWVGLGWALARLPVAPIRVLARCRGLNRWLALDGWGFHEGYFHWQRSISRQRRPRTLVGDAARVFDQGIGRSLWFVRGADALSVAATINAFDRARHADLWAGAGLAAAYAGGVAPPALQALHRLAGSHGCALAQGVVFAAQARRRAGNPAAHTELACVELLGMSASAAADLAMEALPAGDDDLQAYQRWRVAIQQRCEATEPSPAQFRR